MFNALAMAGLAASMLVAPAAPAESAELSAPAEKVVLDVVTVNGSGCPAGSATVQSRPDNSGFQISYSQFLAVSGQSATAVDSRKNCQINVLVKVPPGFTYAIAQAEYQGFAYLPGGATGVQAAHYYIMGTSPTAQSRADFSGPMADYWRTVDRADALVYAPCGADSNININTELRVSAGDSGATSVMTMDSTRGSVQTLFNFSWRQC
jgi:hypothetical protein